MYITVGIYRTLKINEVATKLLGYVKYTGISDLEDLLRDKEEEAAAR
jgi:hypothetical protein